jgi:NAD(P)-dependent dehydrogenase (short-subunit alcohol dehydrogenase family)
MGRLDGKAAFVTGGARGIGRAIVEKFVAEGASVSFIDLDEEAGSRLAQAMGAGASFRRADVTLEADIQQAIGDLVRERGAIDILVNNAGINAYFDAAEMTEAEWDHVFAVDLKGAWLCAKHALRAMKRAGRGSIVNIASIHATLTMAGMFPYAAAKSGLVGMTRSLALDFAPLGIRVNAVLPGWTRTRGSRCSPIRRRRRRTCWPSTRSGGSRPPQRLRISSRLSRPTKRRPSPARRCRSIAASGCSLRPDSVNGPQSHGGTEALDADGLQSRPLVPDRDAKTEATNDAATVASVLWRGPAAATARRPRRTLRSSASILCDSVALWLNCSEVSIRADESNEPDEEPCEQRQTS